jgi:hypothetical protein
MTAKAVLRGKFIAMSAYVKRTERSQINNLMLHFNLLEKKQNANPQQSRREIIKIRVKIDKIGNNFIIKHKQIFLKKSNIQRIKESKSISKKK